MDVVSMELSSTIFISTNYLAAIGLLNNSDDDDDNDYDDDDEYDDDDDDDDDDDNDEDDYFDLVIDDDYQAYFDKRSGPAPVTAVEGLKMVIVEEPDSCSICLEDLGLAVPVLAMPYSHLFHSGCLKKWLERSCSCPLCRFSLPQEH
ncbi:E3 ubiquitin-protein ligase SIRP1-like [Zingiber officinale]|uniref:E3 ubiquitin-protein ligase SIRP1-like n=1 Tax=Zingiber officinale TaxID=94328 RepID=UPI001C4AA0B1|nr:E3 ubiquitin-protein ligase SIRP1-like [Zingiber officinale]